MSMIRTFSVFSQRKEIKDLLSSGLVTYSFRSSTEQPFPWKAAQSSPNSSVQSAPGSSSLSSAQTVQPIRNSSTVKPFSKSSEPSPPHGSYHNRYLAAPLAFIAAVTAAFQECNASLTKETLIGRRPNVSCRAGYYLTHRFNSNTSSFFQRLGPSRCFKSHRWVLGYLSFHFWMVWRLTPQRRSG